MWIIELLDMLLEVLSEGGGSVLEGFDGSPPPL